METLETLKEVAEIIRASGKAELVTFLEIGENGETVYSGNRPCMEAYRIGLNIYLRKVGIGDLVSAEEIKDGFSTLTGFADKLNQRSGAAKKEGRAYMDKEEYEGCLERSRKRYILGLDSHYPNYIRGSLIAIRVIRDRLAANKTMDETLCWYFENELRNDALDLMERLENPRTYELRKALSGCLENEDYEGAAIIRDDLDTVMNAIDPRDEIERTMKAKE